VRALRTAILIVLIVLGAGPITSLIVQSLATLPRDNAIGVILYALGALLPLLLVLMTFLYSESSRWIRSLCVAWASVAIACGTVGFIRLFYSTHFTRQGQAILEHWKTLLGGILIGLLISAMLSPDFWKVSRHYRGY
jgi:hypothetical protein